MPRSLQAQTSDYNSVASQQAPILDSPQPSPSLLRPPRISTMPPPRSRFYFLPELDSSFMSYLGPAFLLLATMWGLAFVSTLFLAIRGPSWHPGIEDLSKIGRKVGGEEKRGLGEDEDEEKAYDVVIVGGGTCGCVLAARLSENPNLKVLILEAGHAGTRQLFSRIPATFSRMFQTNVDWNFWTEGGEKAEGVKGRSLQWPRARMLGGCSSINAMICHHSAASDFDEWESLGASGWSYSSLLPYFFKSQTLNPHKEWPLSPHPNASEARGKSGPVNVGYAHLSPMTSAFMRACGALGIKIRKDLNTDGEGEVRGTLGVSRTQTCIHGGERVSTATAYLTEAVVSRPNLTIATGATVTRIIFSRLTSESKPRATSVEFTPVDVAYAEAASSGARYRVRAKKQVIVCAGSILTPQLLEVSGIGRRDVLEKAGVPVLVDLPSVGENLKDHTAIGLNYQARPGTSLQYIADPIKGLAPLIEWLRYKTGPLTTNAAEAMAFVRSSDPSLAKASRVPASTLPDVGSGGTGPDIEFLQAALAFREHGRVKPVNGKDFYSIGAVLLRPQSKGSVHITSASTLDKPSIDARILADENDVKTLVWGLKLCHKIASTEPLASMILQPYDGDHGFPPFPEIEKWSDDALADWVRQNTSTMYHPVGTVKMGRVETGGCLDASLRVHGTDALRVCDASIFPEQISGHPMAPLIAIAERFADELKLELV
ncbi:hypothetical protein P7C70_g5273, partial [Phenoliferia sp. Uapishka_3]